LKPIAFHKVHHDLIDIEFSKENLSFKGTIHKKKHKFIFLNACLSGNINTDCAWCSQNVTLELDEKVELLLYDGIYESDEESYDIIEVVNSEIDIEEIFNSEINLIKSDYHICDSCQKNSSQE
jgi:uncharacterized metal-binding protein YceD (DUF177 family)